MRSFDFDIIKIARSLPVEVVAEGVETEAQVELLIQAGCTSLQSYYLSGPPAPLQRRKRARAA